MVKLLKKDKLGITPVNYCRDLTVLLGPASASVPNDSDMFVGLPWSYYRTLQRLEPFLSTGAHVRLDISDFFGFHPEQIESGFEMFWSVLILLYRKVRQVSVAIQMVKGDGQTVKWVYVLEGAPQYELDEYEHVNGEAFRNTMAQQRWLRGDFSDKLTEVSCEGDRKLDGQA
jgi:hypothetical protein